MNANRKLSSLVAFLSLLIAALSLYILYCGSCEKPVDANTLINTSSAITTGLAFLVGCYFALLAVSAYSHFKDIEKISSTVTTIAIDSQQTLETFRKESKLSIAENNKSLKEMIDMIDEIIGVELYISSNHMPLDPKVREGIEKRRNSLLRKRALLALKYKYFQSDRRINLIRELFEVGNKSDIPFLEKAISHNSDSPEIKEILEAIIDKLRGAN